MLTPPEYEQLRLLLITIERLEIENPEVLRKKEELWERASLVERLELYKEILFDAEGQEKVEQPLLDSNPSILKTSGWL